LGLEVSRQTIYGLSELTYRVAESLAGDIRAFAHHANRTTVSVEDIKLASRKNPEMMRKLADFSEGIKQSKTIKKRKSKAAKASEEGKFNTASD